MYNEFKFSTNKRVFLCRSEAGADGSISLIKFLVKLGQVLDIVPCDAHSSGDDANRDQVVSDATLEKLFSEIDQHGGKDVA